MSVVSTSSFLHFTSGGIDTLKLILQNGFRISVCHEITGHTSNRTGEQLVTAYSIPMVCFCDIPPRLIARHASFYCKNPAKDNIEIFGIGMKRRWGLGCGLNPIAYTSDNSQCYEINETARTMYSSFFDLHSGEKPAVNLMENWPGDQITIDCRISLGNGEYIVYPLPRRFLFDKLTQSDYYRLNTQKVKERQGIGRFTDYIDIQRGYDFYDEREWRFVPSSISQVNLFESTMKNRELGYKLISMGFSFDSKFADNAFHDYLHINDKYVPDFLQFSIHDISVIIVGTLGAKETLIKDIREFSRIGGQTFSRRALSELPSLIRTYDEFKELENI